MWMDTLPTSPVLSLSNAITLVVRIARPYLRGATSPRLVAYHSCSQPSFLAFCLDGLPAIYTIYIPCIPFIYSMYKCKYIHIWRAARNVKIPPAKNYVANACQRTEGAMQQPQVHTARRHAYASSPYLAEISARSPRKLNIFSI